MLRCLRRGDSRPQFFPLRHGASVQWYAKTAVSRAAPSSPTPTPARMTPPPPARSPTFGWGVGTNREYKDRRSQTMGLSSPEYQGESQSSEVGYATSATVQQPRFESLQGKVCQRTGDEPACRIQNVDKGFTHMPPIVYSGSTPQPGRRKTRNRSSKCVLRQIENALCAI